MDIFPFISVEIILVSLTMTASTCIDNYNIDIGEIKRYIHRYFEIIKLFGISRNSLWLAIVINY